MEATNTEKNHIQGEDGAFPPDRALLLVVLGVVVFAWCLIYGVNLIAGEKIPAGRGYPQDWRSSYPLFRFDSDYYMDLAEQGYSYDGNSHGSPNIVFLPLFPICVKALSLVLPIGTVHCGFILNFLLLLAGTLFLASAVHAGFGRTAAYFVVLGVCLSPGSFFLHAFYSEASMLFFLGLAFYCYQKKWDLGTAVSCFFLTATRTTAGPIGLLFAFLFAFQAYKLFRAGASWRPIVAVLLLAPICLGGAGLYLGYIWFEFGDPFVLIPQIQMASWGAFHSPVKVWEFLTFKHLFVHAYAAFGREIPFWQDIKTTNLILTFAGVVSAIYMAIRYTRSLYTWAFVAYMALIYYSNAGSEFLISNHRHMTLMIPIYLMIHDIWKLIKDKHNVWTANLVCGTLLFASIFYLGFYSLMFSRGYWFYF